MSLAVSCPLGFESVTLLRPQWKVSVIIGDQPLNLAPVSSGARTSCCMFCTLRSVATGGWTCWKFKVALPEPVAQNSACLSLRHCAKSGQCNCHRLFSCCTGQDVITVLSSYSQSADSRKNVFNVNLAEGRAGKGGVSEVGWLGIKVMERRQGRKMSKKEKHRVSQWCYKANQHWCASLECAAPSV